MIKVLVGCECSGRVAMQFALFGYEAYSCDLKRGEMLNAKFKSGGVYKHIQDDVFEVIRQVKPDVLICHPPCTFVAVSGAKWLDDPRYPDRRKDKDAAVVFARRLWRSDVKHICMENPVGMLSTAQGGYDIEIGKPTQIIQPWQFGEEVSKTTCLWLKNLPQLKPTNIVGKGEFVTTTGGKKIAAWYSNASQSGGAEGRRTIRSRTSLGIAKAMADQWGNFIKNLDDVNQIFLR